MIVCDIRFVKSARVRVDPCAASHAADKHSVVVCDVWGAWGSLVCSNSEQHPITAVREKIREELPQPQHRLLAHEQTAIKPALRAGNCYYYRTNNICSSKLTSTFRLKCCYVKTSQLVLSLAHTQCDLQDQDWKYNILQFILRGPFCLH